MSELIKPWPKLIRECVVRVNHSHDKQVRTIECENISHLVEYSGYVIINEVIETPYKVIMDKRDIQQRTRFSDFFAEI
ncbi:hypothetical protein GCM10011328_22270 [Hafnia psychrotolerans]|uniref:Uncharacterized protein n=1 Tax=Hafnia psychrotolerans TaxID=1477018 RepID=A0ABQ1GMG6_9GAMM|nr:hypothetical protein GCM10011328_22270 [Hafnia psychrotolerans]